MNFINSIIASLNDSNSAYLIVGVLLLILALMLLRKLITIIAFILIGLTIFTVLKSLTNKPKDISVDDLFKNEKTSISEHIKNSKKKIDDSVQSIKNIRNNINNVTGKAFQLRNDIDDELDKLPSKSKQKDFDKIMKDIENNNH